MAGLTAILTCIIRRGEEMKKRIYGIFCVLCIAVTSLSQEAAAVEPQNQIAENPSSDLKPLPPVIVGPQEQPTESQPSNTTMEKAVELENMKLYDDVFTAERNTRYYKITVKKMADFVFNVNSDAKGEVKLLNEKGQMIIGWKLRGKNWGFTYTECGAYDPGLLLYDTNGHWIGEEELLEPGTYYVQVAAKKEQFGQGSEEIRFHAMGTVQELEPYLTLKKGTAVYTGKKIAIPKVKANGKEKYDYNASGKKYLIKYNRIFDRQAGKEVKSIRNIGSYLICNRAFLINALDSPGDSCVVFTVTPQKGVLKEVKSRKRGQIQVVAKKNSAAGRYQIQVSTDKKFETGVHTIKTKNVKQAVKNLEAGKRYYVRVRYYKNVSIKYIHGKGKSQPIYGAWSKTKTVVCK